MKSAFNDIIYEKRGIYGVLHVIILLLSLFLIVVISVDTFKNIPFMTQGSYLKIQFWICMFFIADFVLEFFLSKRKLYYLQTHFIFLIVSIPYCCNFNRYIQEYSLYDAGVISENTILDMYVLHCRFRFRVFLIKT